MAFKDPGFNDRIGAAQAARQKALESLKAKPPVDEAKVAAKRATEEVRAAAAAEKRAVVLAERERIATEKREMRELFAAEEAERAAAKAKPQITDEEKKAIRDARYAARKARKK